MQCVILAGGLGTRLRSVAGDLPKALVPVAGRPFADHQLEWLARDGVTGVVYCIGHRGELIREHVGDGARWGLRVDYVDEGDDLRGTGGALRLALDQDVLAPAFGVLYGDSYLAVDPVAVMRAFEQGDADVVMTVYRNEGRWDASNVRLGDDGRVLYDKGVEDARAVGMHHIDYGLSVVRRDVVPEIPPGSRVDMAEVLGRLSRAGRIAGFEVRERFYEVGTPESLAELERRLTDGARV